MNKSKIVLLVVTILVFLGMVSMATYSFFATGRSESNLEYNVSLPNKGIFTSYSTDPLAFSLDAPDFATASTTAKKTDTGNIIVKYISNANDVMHCTYDIRLVWDSVDQYTSPSTTLPHDNYSYELSILGSRTTTDATSGHSYTNISLSETNLTNLSWNGTAGSVGRYATLINGAEIYNKSASTYSTTTWTFTMKFYSLPVDQELFENKNYNLHLQVANIVC